MATQSINGVVVTPVQCATSHDTTEYQQSSSSSSSSPPEQTKLSDSDVSDEDAARQVPDAEADQVEDVLGVSIGREQSRLKARQTPAEEKSRAIESSGGYFNAVPASQYLSQMTEEPDEEPQSETVTDTKTAKEGRYSFTRSLLKSSFSGRSRASSGDSIYNLNLRKFLPDISSISSLSALTKRPGSPSMKSKSLNIARARSASSPFCDSREVDRLARINAAGINTSSEENVATLGPMQNVRTHSYQRLPATKKRQVRPSVSDESLYVRNLSRASTLENRPHYENIHSMVNSRYKAIKDSLQDSSSRLLSMPNFNLPDFRNEWYPSRFLGDYQRKEPGQVDQALKSSPKVQTWQNSPYPMLDQAASRMEGDVVVMGGYRGSILRSAKPPHRQLWVPMKVGLNIRKVDLEVGLSPEDEERMEETIIASEVLSHIGPVDICRRLLQRLRKAEKNRPGKLRVWDYGYDWRLSPHLLSKRLIKYLEGLPCNSPDLPREKRGAYVIAHSLGGLITRHAVNQRPELFAGVVFAGTPQHCVNILGPLRNGDEVLLSSKVLTAQVNFSIRTSYALLPDDGRCFIDKVTKEEYLVDFFDVNNWDEYALSPCIRAPSVPAGNDTKKGLMDNLQTFQTFPKIGLGKRLSVKLGKPKEKDQEEMVGPDTAQTTAGQAVGSLEGVVGPNTGKSGAVNSQVAAATCTIPRKDAMEYLERTLKEVRQFREELAFNEAHQSANRYPPLAVLYSKALPTVYGARVQSRDCIKQVDAYDDLAFAAGDGVCLASAAMLPSGYRAIKHGLVRSDRGHVGLLGDLEGVGQCLMALINGRRAGVGLGAIV
ncbi:hypothetical protein BGW36DRAFT_369403 [Talaromyces proteolyticus]|uniref:Uncharacterized protein n=1 Tax=Talaromyces proteolyticus TaxID=1131652 RepID=A0AAD4KZI3_9EURO|nr:uncharacterized protein BGW36DRAFT_369403 [Talaromyces proteolyticus]KAH8703484.1 hypothetical protein BGW36DRAFT_369403 [Talaromyces proteolyticus]